MSQSRRRAIISAVILSALFPAQQAGAQLPRRFFPERSLFPQLLAAPHEAVTAGRLIIPFETPSRFGTILEGEAAFGASLPLYLIAGTSRADAVVIGVAGGVFGRFNLETRERDLITSDWIFSLPILVHRGSHWLRVRYFHTSAHFGDEYLERFNVERRPYARDLADLTMYFRPLMGLGLYGVGRWAFRVDPPEHKRWVVGGGVELERQSGSIARPYAAADFRFDQNVAWDPQINLQAGVRLDHTRGAGNDHRLLRCPHEPRRSLPSYRGVRSRS
jgi:hypothetical protein